MTTSSNTTKMSPKNMLYLHFKSSTKTDAQNVGNMEINLVIPGAKNHSHSHKTRNLVLFERIPETLEVLIGKDLSTNVPNVGIKISFLDAVISVAMKDIDGVISQK